jgi:bifunctional DNA-binding transcriptional regulator/antitoxin component of YhaV-PrlF toxin-antitoxin module
VTSKLQVTIPKAIAERYGIEPGTDVDWLPAGDAIRVVPSHVRTREPDRSRRLELFDRSTERQRDRQDELTDERRTADRGWRREDLYGRGVAH